MNIDQIIDCAYTAAHDGKTAESETYLEMLPGRDQLTDAQDEAVFYILQKIRTVKRENTASDYHF